MASMHEAPLYVNQICTNAFFETLFCKNAHNNYRRVDFYRISKTLLVVTLSISASVSQENCTL